MWEVYCTQLSKAEKKSIFPVCMQQFFAAVFFSGSKEKLKASIYLIRCSFTVA